MTLQHQETQEPPTSEVVRLAQQMYERDRAEQERQTSLAAAAEEMGIPSEYLEKAAAQLKARRVSVTQQPLAQRRPIAAVLILALGLMIGVLLLFFMSYAQVQAPMPAPPTPIQMAPPSPLLPSPTPAPPVTEPPQPYPVPGTATPPPTAGSQPSPSTGY